MKRAKVVEVAGLLAVGAMLMGVLLGAYFVASGVTARAEPGTVERVTARTVRGLAISMRTRSLTNPIPASAEVVAEGREHFADHCAVCHGNDGSGNTEMGRGLYPRAPDMRLPATQQLGDAELFYIIENGVKLTGMPAWGVGTKVGEDESWNLVHFIRHLPQITPEEIQEMEALNPKPPDEIRQEIEAERFLRGDEAAAPPAEHSTAEHEH